MDLFYIPNINTDDEIVNFPEDEKKHIIKVFRKKEGDLINVTNGKGLCLKVKILINSSNKLYGKVDDINHFKSNKKAPVIAISPTKNISRFEWFMEKACEIGIKKIVPLITNNSERRKININRCNKILIAAMKQSQNYFLPEISNPIKIDEFIINQDGGYIAHCKEGIKKDFLKIKILKDNPTILIGPEGGFTSSEIKSALRNNFTPVSFGNNRLRTETAGIFACFKCF